MILSKLIADKAAILGVASEEIKEARDLYAGRKLGNSRLFMCEGLWAADKLVEKGLLVKRVFFDNTYFPERASEKEQKQLAGILQVCSEAYSISPKACSKISDRDGADICFIVAEMPSYTLDDIPLSDNMITIILDGQEQPGNVGAILRSLDGAGGSFAIMTNRRVRLTHSRLIRSSLGAAFMMPVVEVPMEELAAWLLEKGFRLVLTDLTATKSYCDIDHKGRIAIVAGNEYLGISDYWRHLPNAEPIIIPMLGSVESLNVGFASTLVAYDIGLKQKNLK
jgi:TrmH family RNA methyltransferase